MSSSNRDFHVPTGLGVQGCRCAKLIRTGLGGPNKELGSVTEKVKCESKHSSHAAKETYQ